MATGLVVRGGADGIFGQQTRTRPGHLPARQRSAADRRRRRGDGAAARPAQLPAAGGEPAGGGSTASGFAELRRARRPGRRPAAGADQRRHQLQRRRRRSLRLGDRRGGDEVPAGPRPARRPARSIQATASALGLPAAADAGAVAASVSVTMQAHVRSAKGPCWYGDTWQAARGSGRVHLGVDIGAPSGHAAAGGRLAAG